MQSLRISSRHQSGFSCTVMFLLLLLLLYFTLWVSICATEIFRAGTSFCASQGKFFWHSFIFFEVISIVFMLWFHSLCGQQGPIHAAPADSAVPRECTSCTDLGQNTIQSLQIDRIWICHSFEVEPSFTLPCFFYSPAYCVMWVTSLLWSQVFRHHSWFFSALLM